MGYLSHKVDPTKIKAGDHTYTWRTAYTYSHHGIYVGANKVVHFTAPDDSGSGFSWLSGSCFGSIDCGCSQPKSASSSGSSRSLNCGCSQPKSGSSSSSSSSLCSCLSSNLNQPATSCLSFPDCGFQQPGSGVILYCLNCFVGTGSLYLYQYGLNKYVYMSKLRGGTCTIAKSDPPQDVIDRAMYLLQNDVFGDYHVVKNNCEDFALYCKTGLLIRCNPTPTTGSSGQVNFWSNVSWKSFIYSAAEKVVRTTMPYVTVTVEIGVHSWKKYKTDIGVRDDVEKVKVEEVASFGELVNRGR